MIREARPDDLRAAAAAVAGQPLLLRYGVTADSLAADLEAALGRGDGLLVADQPDGIGGLAWFLYSGTFHAGGYLRLIALAPGGEGQGLGAALLDEVERRVAKRARALFLLVSHWNEGARRFYAGRGYIEAGTLHGFVLPDTDEVICWKRLR